MTDYEGFSKQDLKDRHAALLSELHDLHNRSVEIEDEIDEIDKLLDE